MSPADRERIALETAEAERIAHAAWMAERARVTTMPRGGSPQAARRLDPVPSRNVLAAERTQGGDAAERFLRANVKYP